MEKERIIDKLRRGEKVLCPVCKKDSYDNDGENISTRNYFHCRNANCRGYVHEQNIINVE